MIGLTFQQVQKYEKGVNRVAGTLYDIAKVLDLPISWFFDEDVVDRIGGVEETAATEFKDCMDMLLDLRQSSKSRPCPRSAAPGWRTLRPSSINGWAER